MCVLFSVQFRQQASAELERDITGKEAVQVVKDYKRSEQGEEYDPSKYAVSPITGELVPLAEMQEHMRINLIDPKCCLLYTSPSPRD